MPNANAGVQAVRVDQVMARESPFCSESIEDSPTGMITEVQLNETLDGRLQIEGVISRSGMASIYKAKDLMTGQAVAVKIPYQQFESDPASFARFQREAEIGKKLNHPNILRLLDVGEHSRPYIVMEYLEGKTLDRVMNKIPPLPISGAAQIVSQVWRRTRLHARA